VVTESIPGEGGSRPALGRETDEVDCAEEKPQGDCEDQAALYRPAESHGPGTALLMICGRKYNIEIKECGCSFVF
jgi:hypothetical protein